MFSMPLDPFHLKVRRKRLQANRTAFIDGGSWASRALNGAQLVWYNIVGSETEPQINGTWHMRSMFKIISLRALIKRIESRR